MMDINDNQLTLHSVSWVEPNLKMALRYNIYLLLSQWLNGSMTYLILFNLTIYIWYMAYTDGVYAIYQIYIIRLNKITRLWSKTVSIVQFEYNKSSKREPFNLQSGIYFLERLLGDPVDDIIKFIYQGLSQN